MAIAFGASLGTPVKDTEADTTSIAMTTSVTVPPAATAFLGVTWYSGGTASVSGYTQDRTRAGVVDGNRHIALFRQEYAAGLASGSTLTANFSTASFGRAIFGSYFTGLTSISPLDQVNDNQGTVAAWTGGSITTVNADDLLVGISWFDAETTTETPAGGYTEAIDTNNALNASWAMVYQIVAAATTYSPGGTWAFAGTAGREWLSVSSSYKADTGGGVVVPVLPPAFNAIPFMGVPISG